MSKINVGKILTTSICFMASASLMKNSGTLQSKSKKPEPRGFQGSSSLQDPETETHAGEFYEEFSYSNEVIYSNR